MLSVDQIYQPGFSADPQFGCTHFAEREMIPEISCDICGIVTKNLNLLCKVAAKLSKIPIYHIFVSGNWLSADSLFLSCVVPIPVGEAESK